MTLAMERPAPVHLGAPAFTSVSRNVGTPPPHGELSRFKYWGCRCFTCRFEHYKHDQQYRAGTLPPSKVPSIGLIRRIRALKVAGFSYRIMAEHSGGLSRVCIASLARARWKTVNVRTAERVRAMYLLLVALDPPSTDKYDSVPTPASWCGSDAWDETTIDDPAAKPGSWRKGRVEPVVIKELLDLIARDPKTKEGRKPAPWGGLSMAEKIEIVRLLSAQNMSFNQIALNVGAHPSHLTKWLKKRHAVVTFETRPNTNGVPAKFLRFNDTQAA